MAIKLTPRLALAESVATEYSTWKLGQLPYTEERMILAEASRHIRRLKRAGFEIRAVPRKSKKKGAR